LLSNFSDIIVYLYLYTYYYYIQFNTCLRYVKQLIKYCYCYTTTIIQPIVNVECDVMTTGLANTIAPMFLSEIAPFNYRGAFGTLHQLLVTGGIFLSSVFGLKELLGTRTHAHTHCRIVLSLALIYDFTTELNPI